MAPRLAGRFERLWNAVRNRSRLTQVSFWAGWCVPPLVARVLMHVGREIWPGMVDMRGVLSDVMVGCGLALLGLLLVRLRNGWASRMLLATLALFWTMFNYAASEHVLALDAPIDVRLIGYLGDETFLAGSWTMIEHPLVLLALMLFAPVAVYRGSDHLQPTRSQMGWTGGSFFVLLFVSRLWTPSVGELSWRQLHFLELAPLSTFSESPEGAVPRDDPRLVEMFGPQLDGVRRVPVPERRPNILLVMVEGMTGAYIPPIAQAHAMDYHMDMSRLGERASQEGLYFSAFINHQRQTNRGEYTLLCGDYPKLSSETSKMSDYVIASDRRCLPDALRREGYHTAYLQAANLRFMMKDQFMSRAGFDEVRGAESFTRGYASSGWGVDDRGFYEGVLDRLVEYEKSAAPWFATVLTVGTHAPFPVPESFEGDPEEPPRERAFRYADFALDELLDGLEREGLADHTLVLITSDESAGLDGDRYGDLTHMLATNWGAMVVLGPGIGPEHEAALYGQSDVAISILDYLGLANEDSAFAGRSLFRRYEAPRAIGFANAYSHVEYSLDEDGRLVMCPEIGDACVGYALTLPHVFAADSPKRPLQLAEVAFLRGLVARADETAASRDRDNHEIQTLALIDPKANVVPLAPKGERTPILSGQAILVSEDQRYHVELRYRAVGEGVEADVESLLWTRGETVHFQSRTGPLHDGDTISLEYGYVPEAMAYDVDVVLRAVAQSGGGKSGAHGSIVVEKAEARLEPLPPGTEPQPGFEIQQFSVEHDDQRGDAGALPYHRVDLRSSFFWRAKCIRDARRGSGADERWRGHACREGEIIRGPGSFAPRGSRVRAKIVLVGAKGRGRGHVELRLSRGKEKHGDLAEYGRQKTFAIAPGERVEIEFDETVAVDQQKSTVVLVIDEAEPLTFDVEALEFEVVPPETLIRWSEVPQQ